MSNISNNCKDIPNGPWTIDTNPATPENEANQLDADSDRFGNFCDPDINNDTVVNWTDATLIWEEAANGTNNPVMDLNGDGIVNNDDANVVIAFGASFGNDSPPGPSGLCANSTLGIDCEFHE